MGLFVLMNDNIILVNSIYFLKGKIIPVNDAQS